MLSPSEKPEKERKQNAYKDACCKREVEGEILFLNKNIPRQSAEPRYPTGQDEYDPYRCYNQAEHDEHFADMLNAFMHGVHDLFPFFPCAYRSISE